MYRILLLIHVLAGMAWVGGGFVIQVTSQRALKTAGVPAAGRVIESFRWADTWLAIGVPILVVATGVTMVAISGAWTFAQTWVWVSIALVVGYEAIAGTVGGRLYRAVEATMRESDSTSNGAQTRLYGRYMQFGMALLLVLIVLVVLMVYKPGV